MNLWTVPTVFHSSLHQPVKTFFFLATDIMLVVIVLLNPAPSWNSFWDLVLEPLSTVHCKHQPAQVFACYHTETVSAGWWSASETQNRRVSSCLLLRKMTPALQGKYTWLRLHTIISMIPCSCSDKQVVNGLKGMKMLHSTDLCWRKCAIKHLQYKTLNRSFHTDATDKPRNQIVQLRPASTSFRQEVSNHRLSVTSSLKVSVCLSLLWQEMSETVWPFTWISLMQAGKVKWVTLMCLLIYIYIK